MRGVLRLAGSILLLSVSLGAASTCNIPSGTVTPPRVNRPDWVNQNAPVDYYMLTLSWSPQFCAGHQDDPKNSFQCQQNKFGFVIHGLWPQSAGVANAQGHPRHCRSAEPIAKSTLQKYLCLVPGVQLMQDEWTKHGTCAFRTSEEYFGREEALFNKLRLADLTRLASERGTNLRAGDVVRAFTTANPGLREQDLRLTLDNRRRLQEVRICYDRHFAFRNCEGGAPPGSLRITVRPQW